MYADICTWQDTPPINSISQSSTQRKILVVDDHPLMLRGYRALVQLEPDLSICDEATSGYEALEKLYGVKPDLVVTDVSMKGLNGFELTRRIKGVWADLPVLVASSFARETHGQRARLVGARGFIEKNELPEHGVNVMRCALTSHSCGNCPYLFDR